MSLVQDYDFNTSELSKDDISETFGGFITATELNKELNSWRVTAVGDWIEQSKEATTLGDWMSKADKRLETNLVPLAKAVIAMALKRKIRTRHTDSPASSRQTLRQPVSTRKRSAQGFIFIPVCTFQEQDATGSKKPSDTEMWRIHIWLSSELRGENNSPHTHQQYARSEILGGQIVNKTWDCAKTEDPKEATHVTWGSEWSNDETQWSKTYSADAKYTRLHKTDEWYIVKTECPKEEILERGMTYTLLTKEFHSSHACQDRTHATLCVFDKSRGFEEEGKVLHPIADDANQVTERAAVKFSVTELANTINGLRNGNTQ